jgi:hypothetical protein
VSFLLIGLIVGAIAGYLTRPESAEIRIGPLQVEITGKGIARDGGSLTSSQVQHIALLALIGGAIGLGLGYAAERGRLKF